MSIVAGDDIRVPFSINQVDTLAGTSFEAIAPADGFIKLASVIVQTAVTTGGAVTLKVGTVDVDGLSVVVPSAAPKGSVYSDAPTAAHGSRKVKKGDRIQVVPSAAFDVAGALNGYVEINTAI